MLKKKNGGFTLLEVIISIAALSIISIFILRMFLASSNLNDRAKDIDIAVNLVITEIESVKKQESLSAWLSAHSSEDISESGGITTVRLYYDKGWGEISGSEEARYRLEMVLSPDEAAPSNESGVSFGRLYLVQAEATDMGNEENVLSLALLQTKKYFPKGL